jgi:hypothetical protein
VTRDAKTPLQRLGHMAHPSVAFATMPVFVHPVYDEQTGRLPSARETNERHPRHRAEDEDRLHDRPGQFVPGAAPGAPRAWDERGPAQLLSR